MSDATTTNVPTTAPTADAGTDAGNAPSLLRRALRAELGMWRSLYLWTARRPVSTDPSDVAFGYLSLQAPIIWAFIGVSAVEIPVAHLILPWPVVRIIFLVIGVWGLLWMFGYLGSHKKHPHLVGDAGLRVRNSVVVDVPIAWENVAGIRQRRHTLEKSTTVQFTEAGPEPGDGTILHVVVSGQTNIEITLRQPVMASLMKGDRAVTAVHFYADDPKALVAMARERLAAATG